MLERSGELALVLSTVADAATGEWIARQLVEERLVACANLVPGLTSVYRWEGAVNAEPEVLMLMKTPRTALERLARRLPELHPYQVPELIVLPVEAGLQAYCSWVTAEVPEVEG